MKKSNKNIEGVDDALDFKVVLEAFRVIGFEESDQMDLFRVLASILHLGNMKSTADKEDQAEINDTSVAEKICHLLGVPVKDFVQGLIKPSVKAGREWVVQSRTVEQVSYSLESLAKAIYERMFGKLIEKINLALYTSKSNSNFIGVLDIAGFEIFEVRFPPFFFKN